jgi:hypothetical protein
MFAPESASNRRTCAHNTMLISRDLLNSGSRSTSYYAHLVHLTNCARAARIANLET